MQAFDLGKKCPTCLAWVIEEVRKDPMGSYCNMIMVVGIFASLIEFRSIVEQHFFEDVRRGLPTKAHFLGGSAREGVHRESMKGKTHLECGWH